MAFASEKCIVTIRFGLIKYSLKRLSLAICFTLSAQFIVTFSLLFPISVSASNSLPFSKLTANNVAVIVNVNDANSVVIGDYYINARNIPKKI